MTFAIPKGLTQRFLLLGLILVAIPITVIFILAVVMSQYTLQKQADEQTLQAARTTANQTQELFQSKKVVLESIVENYYVDKDERRLLERIETTYLKDPFFLDIAYYNEEGQRVNDSRSTSEVERLMDEMFEEAGWRNAFFISSMKGATDESLSILIAVPVQDDAVTDLDGALIARVNKSYLSKLIQNNRIGTDGWNLLVTKDGDIIADTLEKSEATQTLKSYSFYPEVKKSRISVYKGSFYEEDVIAGYYPIDHLPLYSISIQPKEQAYAPVQTLMKVLTGGWLFILISGLILLFISVRWIVKPVKELTNQTTKYAQGESWHFNILKEKDEIQTLAMAMKHMAESLQEKERFLQFILESFPYGVLTTNAEGTITSMNRAGAQLFIANRSDFINKKYDILPSKGLQNHVSKWSNASTPFEQIEEEFSYVSATSKKLTLKAASSPLMDEKGEIIGILTTFWDHTEMKKLEQHLQRSEHLAAIGQMTAGLAHEVKNPLGTIQLASDVIDAEFEVLAGQKNLNGPGPSMIKEALTDIQEEAKRLNELVTGFLKMSRHHKSEEQDIDIGQLVEEVVRLTSHQMKRDNIELELNIPSFSLYVSGDRNQLVQALLNILLNSMDAMKKKDGGLLRVIVIKHLRKVEIVLEDNGVGIPEPKMKRIFHPFFSTKHEGTGLGLSITHDIIDEHKGQIEVESQVNVGSTVSVSLPLLNR